MRFIILGLLRAWARSNETPVQAATVSLSGCVMNKRAKATMKVLINNWLRAFS
jgi:hypothetical protein